MKIIANIVPTDLVTSSLLSSFCPFLQTKKKKEKKKETGFHQVGVLVTRNIFIFYL